MLKVVNIKKSFGAEEVLKEISFEVEKGELAVVLGKSGAGKTTLMRCITGLENFDSGEIIVDDIRVKDNSQIKNLRGQVGMVFQNFNLFPHLSVLENIIEAPINVFKKDKEKTKKLAMELLEMVGLEDKKDAYPYELSGGQKQRVAIARTCALMPKVLCFDEPTSALDKENIDKVIEIINACKKKKMAILIISHDENFAQKVADKIIYLENGQILEEKVSS